MDIMKMRYSIGPRDRRYVKGYDFYLLLKILIKILVISIVKNLLTVLKSLQQMQ